MSGVRGGFDELAWTFIFDHVLLEQCKIHHLLKASIVAVLDYLDLFCQHRLRMEESDACESREHADQRVAVH